MDLNNVLSTIIIVAFVVTVVLAVGSYMLYKLRERRRPRTAFDPAKENIFFERFSRSQRQGSRGSRYRDE
jgi:heme/copper-type cytochrome/quinol oxidase subunit 2